MSYNRVKSDGSLEKVAGIGLRGIGIKDTEINSNGHLIITYDDDTTEDAGVVPNGVEANPALVGTEDSLQSIEIDGTKYKVFGLKFKTMPSTATLLTMPLGTVFETEGFYTEKDGHGGRYIITTSSSTGRGGLKISNDPAKYLVYIDTNYGKASNYIDVCRYGIREYGIGTVDLDTITAQNTYADINSDIISRIYAPNNKTYFQFPIGRFFFKDPLSLSIYGIRGNTTPNIPTDDASYSGYGQSLGATILYFPFLTNGQSGLTVNLGNIENLVVFGNPRTYQFNIDRSKTITAPDEVVTETIAQDNGEDIKCIGINKTSNGYIKNVIVAYFYTGIYSATANIYMSDLFIRACHTGITVGNDNKMVGIYGWRVHTLLQFRGAISSAESVRVDSCVHVANLVQGAGITLTDVDGDYCTDSLIVIGSEEQWKSVSEAVLTGIHGRCCTLKSYDTTQGTSPDVRDLVDTSGYGVIRILKNCVLKDSYIVFNLIGNRNPFDTSSNYKTPNIALTMAQDGSMTNAQRNQFIINSADVSTVDDIKKVIQTKANASCKVDIATGTFFMNGSDTSTYVLTTDTIAENQNV